MTGLFLNYSQVSSGRSQRLALRHRIKCKDAAAALLKTHVKNFATANEDSRRTGHVWNEPSAREGLTGGRVQGATVRIS